jgi:hypothetical protein
VLDDRGAGEVIRRLRALLKRGETQFQPVDVNEAVNEALQLAHGDIVTPQRHRRDAVRVRALVFPANVKEEREPGAHRIRRG